MTHKQRMLAALRGEPTDLIPWAPRLDLWYNAHKRAGSLAPKYKDAPLSAITDDLDIGFHAVVPNFKDTRGIKDEIHRALGIYSLWTMPYATIIDNIRVDVGYNLNETIVKYQTPFGNIQTKVLYDETMRKAGISITHITEHAIKSNKDYEAISYIFDNARVIPNYGGYEEFAGNIGERGIAVAFVSLAGSPVHLLQRELMPLDLFFYELYDHPEELAVCAESIGSYFKRVFEVVLGSPAEVYLFGANYDASMTYPPFFKKYILPWLKQFAEMLHGKNKYLLTHTDGENSGLLDYYMESKIDIADSVCPAPMTKLAFKEVRDYFEGKITIMGGIPSVALLKNSMSDKDFENYLDKYILELGEGDHLILGISDTTPPDAEFERIIKIGERVKAFGPVR